MNLQATIARMRACGMSAEAILMALECIVIDGPRIVDEQAERRREADRVRKAAKRASCLRTSADIPQNSADPSPLVPPLSPTPPNPPYNPPIQSKPTRARPKTDLPEDWQPDAATWALADELGFTSQEAWDQLERMRDWAKNADGGKGRKSDWNAAFRNWLKRAADDRHGRRNRTSTPSKPTLREGFDILDAVFDEAIRRSDGQGEECREENLVGVPGLRKSAA